jgi:hypothetical protein
MGQGANNRGRQAELDDKRSRATGRQKDRDPLTEAIKETVLENPAKRDIGGAFGAEGMANTPAGANTQGAGGGGGGPSEASAKHGTVGKKKR